MYFIIGFIVGIIVVVFALNCTFKHFKSKGFFEDDLYEDSISVAHNEFFSMKDLITNDKYIAYINDEGNIKGYCLKTKNYLTIFKDVEKTNYKFKKLTIGSKRMFKWLFDYFNIEF